MIALPMQEIGFPLNIFGGGWSATYVLLDVNGRPMRVLLDPNHPRTIANASAAARLASVNGGTLSGEAVPTEIMFGIERPVRTMTLARPLGIGGLTLPTLGVRLSNAGTGPSIPEAGAPPADPAEVVVRGKGKKHDRRRDILTLGADVLRRCSSLEYDKPAKLVRLRCA